MRRAEKQKTWQTLHAADFGLKTDNTPLANSQALQRLSRAIEAAVDATVYFPAGVFLVGDQTRNASAEWYYGDSRVLSYAPHENINVIGAGNVVLIGYGCTLKFADGQRFGAFDPATGDIHSHTNTAFTDFTYRADLGYLIRADDCQSLSVFGFELDGNAANQIIGGWWGTASWQVTSYLIQVADTVECDIQSVHAHGSCLDSVNVWRHAAAETEYSRHRITNCRLLNNGRMALTLSGTTDCIVRDCDLSYSGRAPNAGAEVVNGFITTGPAAGIDIEQEGAGFIRNVKIQDCRFVGNAYYGIVSASGDVDGVEVTGCKFYAPGTDWGLGNTVLINKPGVKFHRCEFYGGQTLAQYAPAGGALRTPHDDATHFYDCKWFDYTAPYNFTQHDAQYMITVTVEASGTYFKDCYIEATDTPTETNRKTILGRGLMLDNLRIVNQKGSLDNRAWLAAIERAKLKDFLLIDEATHTTADGYRILVDNDNEVVGSAVIESPSSLVKWVTWSGGGGGGHTGQLGNFNTWGWRGAKQLFPGWWHWTVTNTGEMRKHTAKPTSDADGSPV